MKITLLVVGKTDLAYISDALNLYTKRLKHYISFEIKYIPDIKYTKNLNVEQQKEKEGIAILSQLNTITNSEIILLDEQGQLFNSVEFSKFLSQKIQSSLKNIIFIIGGPYGFSKELYSKASGKLSLSPMTFTHQMVRLIFIEQLYRAFTIIKGDPYHHI